MFTLQPRPDGTLSGENIRTTSDQCQEKRTVTFTRTGDVDVNADFKGVADPAQLAPRVVSAGRGLARPLQHHANLRGQQPTAAG